MSIFNSLRSRLSYLETQQSSPLMHELDRELRKILARSPPFWSQGARLQDVLVFEISFLFFRYHAFLRSPLFIEYCADYLKSEFRLVPDLAEQVLEQALTLFLRYYDPGTLETATDYDQAWLQHILLTCLFSQDSKTLSEELGFGVHLQQTLLQVVEMGHDPIELQSNEGLTEDHRSQLFQILQSLAEKQKQDPVTMGLLRLEYLILRDPDLQQWNWTSATGWQLFSALLALAPHGLTDKSWQKTCPDRDLSLLREKLLSLGLIYAESRKASRETWYCLSHEGQFIIKDTYASHCLREGLPNLKGLCPLYQSALINEVGQSQPENLASWLYSQSQSMSPEALRSFMEWCYETEHVKTLLEFLESLLHNHAHAWIKVEICKVLPISGFLERSQAILEPLATDEVSPMVRKAAREAIQRLKGPGNWAPLSV